MVPKLVTVLQLYVCATDSDYLHFLSLNNNNNNNDRFASVVIRLFTVKFSSVR